MTPLTIYQDNICKVTCVSNYFIDEYMPHANAAQIKIYLYLLRSMGDGMSTSVCEMADFLNYPEKDIVRALKYWEKQGILALDTDEQNQLIGIHMLPFPQRTSSTTVSEVYPPPDAPTEIIPPMVSSKQTAIEIDSTVHVAEIISESDAKTTSEPTALSYEKPVYSLDDLKQFKEDDSTESLLFIIETYLKRPLNGTELQTIYFFIDTLKMSDDLIDYLFQYCVGNSKTSFHYIERLAIEWAQNGVKTPAQAKAFSYKYAKIVYQVMKALGRSTVPTDDEAHYVHTWSKDMGFTDDIILEACRRSTIETSSNRLRYADGILKSWKNSQVITLKDVEKLDEDFKKRKTIVQDQKPNYRKGNLYQFEQRENDYAALERELLSN